MLDPRCVPLAGLAPGAFALENDGPRRVGTWSPSKAIRGAPPSASRSAGERRRRPHPALLRLRDLALHLRRGLLGAARVVHDRRAAICRSPACASSAAAWPSAGSRAATSSSAGAPSTSHRSATCSACPSAWCSTTSRGGSPTAGSRSGRGCEVDPSARLVGPVIVQDGASIGPRRHRGRAGGDRSRARGWSATRWSPSAWWVRTRVVGAGRHRAPPRVVCGGDAGEAAPRCPLPGNGPRSAPRWRACDGEDRRGRGAGTHPATQGRLRRDRLRARACSS